MPFFNVSGVKLHFPHQPYDVQLDYMEKVVEGLQRGENGLLESPTGTGKTLSLLCGVLGWLAHNRSQAGTPAHVPIKTVYYASRTHAQLKQAIREFRKTRYGKVQSGPNRTTMTALGSRDQLCIHPRMRDTNSAGKTKLCAELRANRECRFYFELEKFLGDNPLLSDKQPKPGGAAPTDDKLDAGEVRKAKRPNPLVAGEPPSQQQGVGGCGGGGCGGAAAFPSQSQRSVAAALDSAKAENEGDNAGAGPDCRSYAGDIEDLVAAGKAHGFCPFFYSRRVMNAVDVVFLPYNYLLDEALRKSIQLNLADSVVIIDEGHNIASVAMDSASYNVTHVNLAEAVTEVQRGLSSAKSQHQQDGQEDLTPVGTQQSEAMKKADAAQNMSKQSKDFKTLAGVLKVLISWLEREVAVLEGGGDHCEKELVVPGAQALAVLEQNTKLTRHAYAMMREIMEDVGDKVAKAAVDGGVRADTPGLQKVMAFLDGVFAADAATLAKSYYLVVYRETQGLDRRYAKHNLAAPIRLGLWCLDASVGMRRLVAPGVRSLFVTSGTLSPLSVFVNDLGLPFDILLQNPHVIAPSQMRTVAVTKGGTGAALDSRYQNRKNPEYVRGLGLTLAALINATPDGFLIFFQSFTFMKEMLEAWKQPYSYNGADPTSIHEAMFRKKPLVEEPSNTQQSAVKLREYRRLIDEGLGDGAVLCGVFRGKMAEGTDFPDGYARGVALVGIPYANRGDLKVRLRNNHVKNDWYTTDALRAISQAIGRAIRHPKDYGSVFLLDERFDSQGLQSQLPRWVGSRMQRVKEGLTPSFLSELRNFYQDNAFALGGHKVRRLALHPPGGKTKRSEGAEGGGGDDDDDEELFADAGGGAEDTGVITLEEMGQQRKRPKRDREEQAAAARRAFQHAREYIDLRVTQEPRLKEAAAQSHIAAALAGRVDDTKRQVDILNQGATVYHLSDFCGEAHPPGSAMHAAVKEAAAAAPGGRAVIPGLEGLPAVGPVIKQYTLPDFKREVQKVLPQEQYDVWRTLLLEFASACEGGGGSGGGGAAAAPAVAFMEKRFVPWLVAAFTQQHADLLRSHVVTLPPLLRKGYLTALKAALKKARQQRV